MVLHSFRASVTVATNIFAFLLPLNTSPVLPFVPPPSPSSPSPVQRSVLALARRSTASGAPPGPSRRSNVRSVASPRRLLRKATLLRSPADRLPPPRRRVPRAARAPGFFNAGFRSRYTSSVSPSPSPLAISVGNRADCKEQLRPPALCDSVRVYVVLACRPPGQPPFLPAVPPALHSRWSLSRTKVHLLELPSDPPQSLLDKISGDVSVPTRGPAASSLGLGVEQGVQSNGGRFLCAHEV